MSQSSWVGKTVGNRYAIEEMLGQGGMSAVYKAQDPNLRRAVAVKLIHSHLSDDPQFVSRFEEEAAAVAQLRHPNIIQVFDFDSDDETYYMVMEFVPGETLQERLKRLNAADKRLETREVVKYGAEVCDALEYAHQRGMIHRDIKPANIMLNVQDEAILMDFGIARIVGGKRHTATGAVIGTAKYMSPEQIRGEQIDPRVDIYSMGVTLFEMLSGRPPFEADSVMTTLMMHINDPVPDLTSLNPDVPPALVQVVGKALEKNREDRYRTAADLAADLRAVFEPGTEPMAAAGPSRTVVEDDATRVETEKTPMPPGEATALEPEPQEEPYEGTVVEPVPESPPPGPATTAEPQPEPAKAGPAAPPPSRPAPAAESVGGGLPIPRVAIFGGAGLLVVLAIILGISLLGGGGDGGDGPTAVAAASATEGSVATQAVAVAEPTDTPPPPTPTLTPSPSATPTVTPTPTETEPAGPFVRINAITIEDNRYVVEYETFGYTETLPGMHVHFYYDTVSEENAGSPGSGPWYLYGGPRPFREYTVASRPAGATQMCARVANPNHSIIPDSGTCMDLPEG